ncbi:hypothetical protein [Streptomyces sp. NPDC059076]|uniref:hypothetical protein n=1 Tax=unclassified Streptomyces TaxID=2593676 RepID=UPI00368242AD
MGPETWGSRTRGGGRGYGRVPGRGSPAIDRVIAPWLGGRIPDLTHLGPGSARRRPAPNRAHLVSFKGGARTGTAPSWEGPPRSIAPGDTAWDRPVTVDGTELHNSGHRWLDAPAHSTAAACPITP